MTRFLVTPVRLIATDLDGTLLRNDLSVSSRGVAVANAAPDTLAAATEITASNQDEGVAAHIERLLP